ncbi:FxSxx-COOH system tetratricopeptide repeat protein [Nonomuraea sp. NPDC005650]|uniref:FxSxx-COOH system tetratricopeptide repeat protein n=1 Tax=Nonomuraea sp. NPDC005650 TaxID=3157045 RepID=UPI0033B847FD
MAGEDLPALVGQIWPYVGSAVGAYGAAVLARAQEQAADSTVSWGQRMLRQIFGSRQQEETPPEIVELGDNPEDEDLQAALRVQIRRALGADPELAAEIRQMLREAEAPERVHVKASHGGVAVGGNVNAPFTTGANSPIDNRHIHAEIRSPAEVEARDVRPFEWPRSTVFVGRDNNLDELAEALSTAGRAAADVRPMIAQQVIYGMGGIGKSELVRQYGARYRDRYEVMVWITADTRTRILQGLAGLAETLHPPITLASDTEHAARWAARWLQMHAGWLVVLDNLEDPADAEEWLDLLTHPNGHVIITTRRDAYWAGAHVHTLDLLSREAATQLIVAVSERTDAAEIVYAEQIAHELGYLPLALEQAAAFICQERTFSLKYYLQQLHEQPNRMYTQTAFGTRAERTIARLWELHLVALQYLDRTHNLNTEHVLRIIAHLAPDNVPRVVLEHAATEEISEELRILTSYSMISRSGEGHTETVSIHRLLQAVVLLRFTYDNSCQEEAREAALYGLIDSVAGNSADDPSGWPLWKKLIPHIDALCSRFESGNEPEGLGVLLNGAGIFALRSQGHYQQAYAYATRALAIAEAILGSEHPKLTVCLGNLAETLRMLGRPAEALAMARRAMAITETVFASDHTEPVVLLLRLAAIMRDLGRPGEALPLEQRALVITEKTLGPDHPDVAGPIGNLATTLRMLGRPGDAVPLFTRALTIKEAALGLEHPSVAVCLMNLAGSLRELGRPGESVPLEERALTILEKALGPDHPDVAGCLGNMGLSLHSLGRVHEAVPLLARALATTEAALGPEHPRVALSLGNLAVSLRELGNLSEAVPLEERALSLTESALGFDHPRVAIRLGNLALTFYELGMPEKAVPLEERALAIMEAALGPSHPSVAIRLMNLAASLRDAGRPEEATPLFLRALAVSEATLGPDHPQTRAARDWLSP